MSVSAVLKRYGQQYLDRFGPTMTAQQKKVLRAVMACREDGLGTIRYACLGCGHEHNLPRSCCNRHCPACQHQAVQAWLQKQRDRLLPCHYFLITFTVPKEVRVALLRHPREGYAAMMSCAAEALKTAATNERHVGATETGFFGVLHTWGRDLTFHPHAHFLVPAGGLDPRGRWTSSRLSVFVPAQILAVLFRNKLRDRLRGTECFHAIPAAVWERTWKVDSKAIADGKHALTYLAPYVLRGAVANWRVTPCDAADSIDNARLSLQVKRSGTKKYRPVPLSVIEFIRRWLLHVLPAGLHRVRHYGFLHGSSRHSLAELKWLVAVAMMNLYYLTCSEELVMANSPKLRCPRCGGQMISLGFAPPTLILTPVAGAQRMSCLSARAPP
jgi:hypothetical protein